MIDFRYYLVSIVSIFLALAVGIVLGAGPLKGDLGARLTEQLTVLRSEKTQLRTDLDTARRGVSARDTFSSTLSPAIMRGRLSGKTVAIVVAPGADADLIKNVSASLISAGAKVGSIVTLNDAWADPSKASMRNTVASPFASLVKAPGAPSSPDQLAASVLSRAILTGTDQSTERIAASAGDALNGLKAGDLINFSPDQIVPSSSVVFLAGPVKGVNPADTTARLASYVQLVRLLDAAGTGVVVAAKSSTPDGTKSEDLVAAVRKDSDAVNAISTVDDADLLMGQDTLVLALVQQHAGGSGQYGLASDAKAVLPDLTALQ
jgi:hypothetical protein